MDICRENYIVRIYRRSKESPYNIIGIIEDVEHEENKAFHNAEELAGIITRLADRQAGEGKKDAKAKQRHNRLRLTLPVKVRGMNIIGKRFSEDAVIKDISSGGAFLYMKNKINADASLRVLIDPNRSCLNIKARVVRIVKEGKGNGVGVAFK